MGGRREERRTEETRKEARGKRRDKRERRKASALEQLILQFWTPLRSKHIFSLRFGRLFRSKHTFSLHVGRICSPNLHFPCILGASLPTLRISRRAPLANIHEQKIRFSMLLHDFNESGIGAKWGLTGFVLRNTFFNENTI